ncbi:MAG: hypothetical protein ACTSO9_02645 [Candidatus Helarchaeota archaeon]
MIFCKRCGSITLDGICINCSGSNFISHPLKNLELRLNSNFFSPNIEAEKLLRWKTSLEDKLSYTPNLKEEVPVVRGLNYKISNISSNKYNQNFDLLLSSVRDSKKRGNLGKNLDPTDNLLNIYPHLKARLDWKEQIQKNSNIISELKNYKQRPETELTEKKENIEHSKPRKNKDTEFFEFKE